jgi:hypothetical protein
MQSIRPAKANAEHSSGRTASIVFDDCSSALLHGSPPLRILLTDDGISKGWDADLSTPASSVDDPAKMLNFQLAF